jgi:uracil-DNA glycosylase
VDRELLARFIAQRVEAGEREWFVPFPAELVDDTPVRTIKSKRHVAVNDETSDRSDQGATYQMKQSAMPKPSSNIQKTIIPPAPQKQCMAVPLDNSHIAKENSLESLNATVCGCLRCPLGGTRTNFVFGSGNPTADIMFVGEAPGADEDKQGLPFVGRAGKLLTDMITATHLDRQNVYIGNILKCRPPGNRDPKPDEIEACEPILIRQIEIIKPQIICALGRIAAQTLLRTTATLGALRGKTHDYHGVRLIVTYHPAALLRNPNFKRPAWEDLKFLRREYDGLEL